MAIHEGVAAPVPHSLPTNEHRNQVVSALEEPAHALVEGEVKFPAKYPAHIIMSARPMTAKQW